MAQSHRCCEICCLEPPCIECSSCGAARVEESGPLLLCAECSQRLHNLGAFKSHKLVKLPEKMWMPLEEQLGKLAEKLAVVNAKREKLQSTVNHIHNRYNEGIKFIRDSMDVLRKAIYEREQVLVRELRKYREQLDHTCKVARGCLESYVEKADEVKSKAKGLREDPSADLEGLLQELMDVTARDVNIEIPGEPDFKFNLSRSISVLGKSVEELLVLPILIEKEEGPVTMQGRVDSNLSAKGEFTLVQQWEEQLRVMSDTIKTDIGDSIQPVFKVDLGGLYAAQYEGEWHRAKVVTVLSKVRVKILYVDYGNQEECTVVDLMSLPGKYLMYPFRAIRCSLGIDIDLSREARWQFGDAFMGKNVTVEVERKLMGADGECSYHVQIMEPRGAAHIIKKILEGDDKHDDPIKFRDVRLKRDVKPSPSEEGVKLPAEPLWRKQDNESQMLFVKGLPPKFSMSDVYRLFSKNGRVHKVIMDISLPGRAWILMEIRGASNAILRLKGLKLPGGDSRGLLIDKTDDYYSDPADRKRARHKGHMPAS